MVAAMMGELPALCRPVKQTEEQYMQHSVEYPLPRTRLA